MKSFGIIGYPLAHSFSQKYFNEKFAKLGLADCEYKVFPIETASMLTKVIEENPSLRGLSVTIPHKETVLTFLDELDESAEMIGAVNCLKIVPSTKYQVAKLVGYNTDAFGFKHAIKPFLGAHHSRALILGTGGAGKAVAYVLKEIGIDFRFVSRQTSNHKLQTSNFTYEELNSNHIATFKFIINCTPLGMYPNNQSFPQIPYEFLTPEHFCFDLVYNPAETLFLKKAKEMGSLTQNGLTMLHQQAEKAWEIWNK